MPPTWFDVFLEGQSGRPRSGGYMNAMGSIEEYNTVTKDERNSVRYRQVCFRPDPGNVVTPEEEV